MEILKFIGEFGLVTLIIFWFVISVGLGIGITLFLLQWLSDKFNIR